MGGADKPIVCTLRKLPNAYFGQLTEESSGLGWLAIETELEPLFFVRSAIVTPERQVGSQIHSRRA
jgi:hypothetical protein